MRQFLLRMMAAFFIIGNMNGCVKEVIIVESIPLASVDFDFWAGARNVEVDGEIFNDGNTFIRAVELEVRMFDEYGYYLSSVFQEFIVNLDPREISPFALDIREDFVFDVDVIVQGIR